MPTARVAEMLTCRSERNELIIGVSFYLSPPVKASGQHKARLLASITPDSSNPGAVRYLFVQGKRL